MTVTLSMMHEAAYVIQKIPTSKQCFSTLAWIMWLRDPPLLIPRNSVYLLTGAGYSSHEFEGTQPIVICGYGYIGEAVAQLLLSPAITNSLESAGSEQLDVVAFGASPTVL